MARGGTNLNTRLRCGSLDFFKRWLIYLIVRPAFLYRCSESIVTKDWKYVRFIDRQPGCEWMYRTGVDLKEKYNLAEDKKYANTKEKLKKRFGELVKEYN